MHIKTYSFKKKRSRITKSQLEISRNSTSYKPRFIFSVMCRFRGNVICGTDLQHLIRFFAVKYFILYEGKSQSLSHCLFSLTLAENPYEIRYTNPKVYAWLSRKKRAFSYCRLSLWFYYWTIETTLHGWKDISRI